MKNYLPVLFLLILSCASTQSTTTCPTPTSVHDTVYKDKLVIDSIPYPVDSFVYVQLPPIHDSFTRVLQVDTNKPYVLLYPDPSGDSYSMLQTAIDNYINQTAGWPYLTAGEYRYSRPLIWAKIVNGDYVQVSPHMEGPQFAKNTPYQYVAHLIPMYNNGFAMAVQKGKGGKIANLELDGPFAYLASLTPMQICTYLLDQWNDGSTSINRTASSSAIVIDPFSPPSAFDGVICKMYHGLEANYLPTMSSGGSTAIKIIGCAAKQFAVGYLIGGGFQQNGEEIDITDCAAQNCISAVANTSAQGKTNTIDRMQIWGNVHTIIDCANWGGPGRAGTVPIVNIMNIGGVNHELIYATTALFSANLKGILCDPAALFKVGFCSGVTGTQFDGAQIDFDNSYAGQRLPAPDCPYYGYNTVWRSSTVRLYVQNGSYARFVWNSPFNVFDGGCISVQPAIDHANPPVFTRTQLFYKNPFFSDTSGSYDTILYPTRDSVQVVMDTTTYTGYVLGLQLGSIQYGDIMLTQAPYMEYKENLPKYNMQTQVGYPTSISGDTTFFIRGGWGIRTGTYYINVSRLK